MSVPPITCLDSGICQPIPDAGYNYAFQQIPNDPQHSIHKYTNENLTEFNTGEEVIDDHNCRHHHHQPSEYVDELNKVPQPKILSLVTNTQQEKIESSSFSAADSLLTESDHAEKVSLTSQHDFFHFERSHHRGEFNHKHVNHENVHLDTMASFASHGSYFEQFLPSNQTQLGVMSSTHSQANAIDDASVNSHSLSLSTLHQTSTSVPVLFNKTNATASPVHHDNYIQPTTTFQSHSVNIPGICHSASSTMETNNQQKQYLDKPNAGSVNRSSEQLLVEENLPHCLQNAPSFARENTLNTQEHCDAQETFTRTSQNLSLPFNKDHLERTPDKRSLVLQHPNKFSSMKACSEPTVMSTFTSISNNVPAAIVSCTPSSHTMHEPRKDSFPSCCMHSHQLPSHESSETCSSTPCINLGSRYVSRSIGEKDISIRQSVMKLTDQPSSFTPLLACSWTSSDLSSTPIGFSSNMDDDDTAKIQVGVSNHSHSRKHSFENFANDERNELLSHFVISRCNTSDKSKGDCNFHSTSKNNNSIYGSDNGPKHVTSSESAFNLSRQTHFPTAICVTPSLVSSFNSNRTAAVNISPHTAHLASSTTGQHQDNYGKGTTTQKDMTFSKVTSCGGSSNVLTTSSESERTLGKYSETLFHGISSISHDTFTSKSHPDIFLQSQQKNQVRVDEEVHEHQPHQRQSESQSNLQSQEINPVSPRLLSLPENAYCSHLSEKPVTVQRQDKLHQHDTQVNLLSGFHSKRCQYSYQNCFQDSSVYLKTTNDLNSNISWSEEKNKREFNICNNNPYRTPTATAAAEGKNQSGSFFNLHAGHLNSRVCLLEQQLRQAQQQISHLEQQLNNCINQIYQDVIEYVQQNFHHEVFTDILDHLYHHHFGDNASGVSMSSETSKRTTLPTQIRTKLRTIVKQQLEQHSVDFAQLGKGTTLSSVPGNNQAIFVGQSHFASTSLVFLFLFCYFLLFMHTFVTFYNIFCAACCLNIMLESEVDLVANITYFP